jgi:Concanavalin A-like lectin/glucanases superfamily/Glycosyl hydrolase-like 10
MAHEYDFEEDAGVALYDGAHIRASNRANRANRANQVLDLTDGFATLHAPPEFVTSQGTIVFWVFPDWSAADKTSHTFVSMTWQGDPASYFAVSQGWWEPDGRGRLYFVLSNQDHAHCSTPFRFELSTWTQIAVAWGNDRCAIYVNGEQVASAYTPRHQARRPNGRLYIGSDAGTSVATGRTAGALLDGFLIYGEALDAARIIALFDRDHPLGDTWEAARWGWLHRATDGELVHSPEPFRHDAIFDEGPGWATSRHSIDARLDRIGRAGFNVYVPSVWHGRGAYFPTRLAHTDAQLRSARDAIDPLDYLIERAHARDVEVHPWFTVALREDDRLPDYYGPGTPADAYDMHNALFRAFMVELIVDVAGRYPIDGVNLDYVRTMGLCVSTSCARNYREHNGHALDVDVAKRFDDVAAAQRLSAWQTAAIDAFVAKLSERLRKIRPGLRISVDVNSGVDSAAASMEGRDAIKWLERGWIDRAYDMQYGQQIELAALDAYRSRLAHPEQLTVLWSNYDVRSGSTTPRAGTVVARLTELARERWPSSGTGFYLYSMLSDAQIDALAGVASTFSILHVERAENRQFGAD